MEYGSVSISLLKKVSFSVIAYTLGYLQYSLVWLVIPVILEILKEKHLNKKWLKSDFVRSINRDGEKDVLGSISNLPAWVCFPDMERIEWLNKIIKRIWPNVNNYVHDIIKELLEEKLNKSLGKYKLSGLEFDKLIVGTVPFRIGGIVVYENTARDEIVLDMDISYAGDCQIILKFGKLKGGIKDFQLFGRLRVIVKPLIDTLPLVGGLQIFFLNPPEIEFELEGLGGVLVFPGLNELLKKLILDTICSVIVLPNKYPLILSKNVSKEEIKIPKPQGVLRIHVLEAKKLMKRDLTFTGTLTSDPYAILTVGDQQYKTPVKKRTAKPKWDYWCEFIIEEINGVYMFISLWDEDTLQDDETLGSAKVFQSLQLQSFLQEWLSKFVYLSVQEASKRKQPHIKTKILVSKLIEKKSADMWFNLETVKHGQVHIRSTWLTLSTNHNDLKNALYEIEQLHVSTLGSAMLIIFIESAADVSAFKSKKVEPYVEIQFEHQEKATRIIKKESNPVWEEGFTFLVTNPENNYICFKIIDNKDGKSLGHFVYNIEALFHENNFKIEKQTFRMIGCESEGKITLSMQLRTLHNSSTISSDDRSVSSASGDENLDNQIEPDNSKDKLSEHLNLSRSSSVSSVSDDSISTRSDFLSPAKIKLTLRYSVQRQRLIIVVHHLEDLHFTDTKGLYVKLYLLPERSKDMKRRTKVLRTSKNPVYDETFEYVISQDELSNKHLEVSVCEEKAFKNEPIEKVVIDLDKLSLVLPHTKLFTLFRKSHQS